MGLAAGTLDRIIRIERPVADDSFTGAGSGTWALVANVWANVQDALPSRGERLSEGVNIAARPSRIRMRRRDDVTAAMRFVLMTKRDTSQVERVMQIIAGPADFDTDGFEFMAEAYSTAGNAA